MKKQLVLDEAELRFRLAVVESQSNRKICSHQETIEYTQLREWIALYLGTDE